MRISNSIWIAVSYNSLSPLIKESPWLDPPSFFLIPSTVKIEENSNGSCSFSVSSPHFCLVIPFSCLLFLYLNFFMSDSLSSVGKSSLDFSFYISVFFNFCFLRLLHLSQCSSCLKISSTICKGFCWLEFGSITWLWYDFHR